MPGVLKEVVGFGNEVEAAFDEGSCVWSPAGDGLLGELVDAGVVSDPVFAQVPVCRGEDEVSVGDHRAVAVGCHLQLLHRGLAVVHDFLLVLLFGHVHTAIGVRGYPAVFGVFTQEE